MADEFSTIPPRWDNEDVNALLDHGLEKVVDYIVRKDGSYYEAIKGATSTSSGTIVYGGADDDGSTSGTDADAVINAAIAAGASVYVAQGTYTLSGPIKILANDRLLTLNPLADIIAGTSDDILQIGNSSNLVYRSHVIGGRLSGDDTANIGFHFYDAHKCSIRNMLISGCNTNAGKFERSWSSDLLDSWLLGGVNTLAIVGASGNQSNHLDIKRSRLLGGSSACVDISGYESENINIEHCNVADSVNGIVVHSGVNLNILKDYFESLSGKDVYLYGDTSQIDGANIKYNRFALDTSTVGVYVDTANDIVAENNQVDGNATFIETTSNALRVIAWPNNLGPNIDNVFNDKEAELKVRSVVDIPIYGGVEKSITETDYTSLDSHVFYFMGGDYENRGWRPIISIIFDAQFKSPSAQTVSLRLYNITDNEVVTNSEITDNTNEWVKGESSDLSSYFEELVTQKALKIQYKTTAGTAYLGRVVLKIKYN